MIAKSFFEAKKLYNTSCDLASNWISRYYPDNNYKHLAISIEKIQAFSQHHFFSCLLEEEPIEDIWTQYPRTVNSSSQRKSLFSKIINRTLTIIRQLSFGETKIGQLGSYEIVILASGRHLSDLISTIGYLNHYYRVLVVGKMTPDIQISLEKEKVNYLNVDNPKRFVSRFNRLRNLLFFIVKPWFKKKNHRLLSGFSWKSRLWYLRLVQFPEIFALVTLANDIFTLTKPRVLFTSTSNDTFGACFTLKAQDLGIKVIELQHGIISYKTIEADFYLSDYYLVWGKISKKFHPKNARIVGCPFLEKPVIENGKKFSKKLKILVLLTLPFGTLSLFKSKANGEVLSDLIRGLSCLPKSYQITLRSHPSFSLDSQIDLAQLPKKFLVDNSNDLRKIIKSHDLIITNPTTAGIVAILYKKPLLFFDNSFLFEKYGEPIASSKSARIIPLDKLESIFQYINDLLKHEDRIKKMQISQERFLENYFDCLGQTSSKKVSRLLEELIHRGEISKSVS